MKRYVKAIVFTISMLACVLFLRLDGMAADSRKIVKNNENFSVTVEMGLGDYVAYGRPMSVKVTVGSKENFEGEVQLCPIAGGGTVKVALANDLTVAAGSASTTTFAVADSGDTGQYCIQILDKQGKVVYKEKEKREFSNFGERIMVGVLSDDYSALNYMEGLSLKIGTIEYTTQLLELHAEDIPEDSTVLSLLNYLVIDNYDTAQLSDAQYEAIKEWVNNGGVLLLGLGSHYQNILHCFQDDFVTGTFGTVDKKNLTWVGQNVDLTEENVTVTTEFAAEDVPCVEYSLQDGNVLTAFSDDGTVSYRDIGKGRVVMLAYDLGMEPIVSNADNKSIAAALFNVAQTVATASYVGGNSYDVSAYSGYAIAEMTDDSDRPSGWLYGGILLAYVLLCGPILYLVLKAMKQREKIWIAVPVMSLVFTGVIYLTSTLYRVQHPIVDTLSMICLDNDRQTERIYTDVICPKAKEYTLVFSPRYKDILYNTGDNYRYSVFGTTNANTDDYSYMIKKTTEGSQLTFRNTEAFQKNTFTGISSGANEIGEITYDLDCTTTGFSGTVTNHTNYDLEGVVVTFENHIYIAGNMKAGETVTIDPDKIKNTTGYGTFNQLYPNGTRNRKAYRYNQIDSMMENYYMRVAEYGRGLIWAKIDAYQPDYVKTDSVKKSGVGVIYTSYNAEYTDVKGVYYQSIDPMVAQLESGDYDQNDRTMYNDTVDITYQLAGYPGITRLQLLSKDDDLSYGVYASVYAYNPKTGDYEEIFKDSDILSGEQLAQYIDNNTLRLRYKMDDSQDTQGYLPRICAKGDE